jgi:hypothetical protein
MAQIWSNTIDDVDTNVEQLIHRLERLPEARFGDPYRKGYLAQLALGVLAAATDCMRPGKVDSAGCLDAAQEAFSELDDLELGARVIDPRNPPPPGQIERDELRYEAADLADVRREIDRTEVVALLRARATSSRIVLRETLEPRVALHQRAHSS